MNIVIKLFFFYKRKLFILYLIPSFDNVPNEGTTYAFC